MKQMNPDPQIAAAFGQVMNLKSDAWTELKQWKRLRPWHLKWWTYTLPYRLGRRAK